MTSDLFVFLRGKDAYPAPRCKGIFAPILDDDTGPSEPRANCLTHDQAMLPQLRSAMNDTVTDYDRGRCAAIVKEFPDAGNGFPLRGNGQRLDQPRMIAHILRVKLTALLADRLCLAGHTCAQAAQRQSRTSGRSSPCSLM